MMHQVALACVTPDSLKFLVSSGAAQWCDSVIVVGKISVSSWLFCNTKGVNVSLGLYNIITIIIAVDAAALSVKCCVVRDRTLLPGSHMFFICLFVFFTMFFSQASRSVNWWRMVLSSANLLRCTPAPAAARTRWHAAREDTWVSVGSKLVASSFPGSRTWPVD